MLRLARNVGEQIVVLVPPSTTEQRIVISLEDIRTKSSVSLGVEARPEVRIHRKEVLEEIEREIGRLIGQEQE